MERMTVRDSLVGKKFYDVRGTKYQILDITYKGVETIGEILVEGEETPRKVNMNCLLSGLAQKVKTD